MTESEKRIEERGTGYLIGEERRRGGCGFELCCGGGCTEEKGSGVWVLFEKEGDGGWSRWC